MAKVYNLQDAESNLPKLIDEVLSGEAVTIARSGQLLVDLSPHPIQKKFVLGSLAHLIENNMTDDEEKAFFEAKLGGCYCEIQIGSECPNCS